MRHILTVCSASKHPGGEGGCQAAPSLPQKKKKKKNKRGYFAYMMMSNILSHLPCKQNQPLKQADN
jgi:hypothetical protein